MALAFLWCEAALTQDVFALGAGLPPVRPIPPLGFPARDARPAHRVPRFGTFFPGFAYAAVGNPVIYSQPPSQTTIVVVQTQAPSRPVETASKEPVNSELKEYKWTKEQISLLPEQRNGTYMLALVDGTRRHAVAVWVQRRRVHFITPDGVQESAALAEIDRRETARLNPGLRL